MSTATDITTELSTAIEGYDGWHLKGGGLPTLPIDEPPTARRGTLHHGGPVASVYPEFELGVYGWVVFGADEGNTRSTRRLTAAEAVAEADAAWRAAR